MSAPGVRIQEINVFPPSVAPVSTAVPAFIGYTERAVDPSANNSSLNRQAKKITSIKIYEELYGGPPPQPITVYLNANNIPIRAELTEPSAGGIALSNFRMYYQVKMYFDNGGGSCYIISVGDYSRNPNKNDFIDNTFGPASTLILGGLRIARKVDEITLLLLPDIHGLFVHEYYELYDSALKQCDDLKDRFTIIDVIGSPDSFRDGITNNEERKYGAAYYPFLKTTLSYTYNFPIYTFKKGDLNLTSTEIATIKNNGFEQTLISIINQLPIELPPSGAVAGIYASVDRNRGVHKAPANVSLTNVIEPSVKISEEEHGELNIHTSGKSINVIRAFTGKGTLVYGARTLDGNSREWKYIPVRRLLIFIEESLKKAIEPFVFEPNDATTWVRIKGLIENFLLLQWKTGALAGNQPAQAFKVNIGLGITMTAQDILEGNLKVEVLVAASRPAEFITLRFSHKLQEA